MKQWLLTLFLLIQGLLAGFAAMLFWGSGRSGDSYSQLAAAMLALPVILPSIGISSWVYGKRSLLPDGYRDPILLGSVSMLIITMLAVATGYLGLSPS